MPEAYRHAFERMGLVQDALAQHVAQGGGRAHAEVRGLGRAQAEMHATAHAALGLG